jgi:hypothetical protein
LSPEHLIGSEYAVGRDNSASIACKARTAIY